MMDLRGHGVAIITPFTDDLSIDFVALGAHLERLIVHGVDYLAVLGTTAETATLSPKERSQIQSFIVDTVAGRLPLVVGIGGNNTQAIVEEIQQTDLTPFSAILSVCPYYNRPNQEGLYQHFAAIANSTETPIILYNVPGRTGCSITAKTVVRLTDAFDNIIGIKDASGDMLLTQNLIRMTPNHFQVVSGEDALTVPVILAGGVGVISVVGNLLPDRVTQVVQWALTHQVKEANQAQYALMDLIGLLFQEGNPTGLKGAMSLENYCLNTLRLPLVPASPSLLNNLRQVLTLLKVVP